MRALMVDPSAYTRPYDAALCAALARRGRAGATGHQPLRLRRGPRARGVRRLAPVLPTDSAGAAGSRLRRLAKLAGHVDDMRAVRALAVRDAVDVTHFQWTTGAVGRRWGCCRPARSC